VIDRVLGALTAGLERGAAGGRRQRVLGRVRRAHRRLNAHGIACSPNDLRLRVLADRHAGQRAFIIGAGPSLRVEDLALLEGEVTFACNKIYLAFDQVSWRPTYYSVVDPFVAEHNRAEIERVQSTKLFTRMVAPMFPAARDVIWVRDLPHRRTPAGELEVLFSTNALEGAHGGWTVLYTQLQLAFYMGITEVYLLGLDFDWKLPAPEPAVARHGDVAFVSGGEVNHFHPDYRKPGEVWSTPKLDLQRRAFAAARAAFERHGRAVYNASRRTQLDVLTRRDLGDVLRG
jgi:hypothetical protein